MFKTYSYCSSCWCSIKNRIFVWNYFCHFKKPKVCTFGNISWPLIFRINSFRKNEKLRFTFAIKSIVGSTTIAAIKCECLYKKKKTQKYWNNAFVNCCITRNYSENSTVYIIKDKYYIIIAEIAIKFPRHATKLNFSKRKIRVPILYIIYSKSLHRKCISHRPSRITHTDQLNHSVSVFT